MFASLCNVHIFTHWDLLESKLVSNKRHQHSKCKCFACYFSTTLQYSRRHLYRHPGGVLCSAKPYFFARASNFCSILETDFLPKHCSSKQCLINTFSTYSTQWYSRYILVLLLLDRRRRRSRTTFAVSRQLRHWDRQKVGSFVLPNRVKGEVAFLRWPEKNSAWKERKEERKKERMLMFSSLTYNIPVSYYKRMSCLSCTAAAQARLEYTTHVRRRKESSERASEWCNGEETLLLPSTFSLWPSVNSAVHTVLYVYVIRTQQVIGQYGPFFFLLASRHCEKIRRCNDKSLLDWNLWPHKCCFTDLRICAFY